MSAVFSLHQDISIQERALENIKQKIKELSSRSPAAKVLMAIVGTFILIGAFFTAYHNWQLYCRITDSKLLAAVPPLLTDGSMVVLLLAFIFWFTDKTQKMIAGIFNLALFVLVGTLTSINGSYAPGEEVSAPMRLTLSILLFSSFLVVLGVWMLILHHDPVIKQHEEKAALEAQAHTKAHEMELQMVRFNLDQQKAEMDYQMALASSMHSARLKALASDDVQLALVELEKRQAILEARNIRGALPVPKTESR